MTGPCVFIVDDQREVARVLAAGLETLGEDFSISQLPSGEEALLEHSASSVDLLIADIKLPGIDGFELMDKLKAKNPELKVILISGVTDTEIRRQVAQAGADAFFFKPIEMSDFLDGVERTLGFVETMLPSELSVEKKELDEEELDAEPKGLSEQISDLRQNLNALSVSLINDLEQVMVRSGELGEAVDEEKLIEDLLAAFGASLRVSQHLKVEYPQSLSHFKGHKFDLYISPVSQYHLLAIALDGKASEDINAVAKLLQPASKELFSTLKSLGLLQREPEPEKKVAPAITVEKPASEELVDPELDEIVTKAKGKKIKKEEVEAFWDSMSETDAPKTAPSGDALTYEQALQLGLAPAEDGK